MSVLEQLLEVIKANLSLGSVRVRKPEKMEQKLDVFAVEFT